MVCPNCHRLQPQGAIECSACGVIFAKFRARPGRIQRLQLDMPKQGPAIAVGAAVLVLALVWSWFNPGTVGGVRPSLTPGGEPVPYELQPGETPEQALARHLRAVDADAVERVALVLEPDWIAPERTGVDQVQVTLLLYTADDTVSASGRVDYTWTRGDERPTTSHSNLLATTFRRGKVQGVGRDEVYKRLLRIDAPREQWAGQPIHVTLSFEGRRTAEATLILSP